jgi:hypothetical protein
LRIFFRRRHEENQKIKVIGPQWRFQALKHQPDSCNMVNGNTVMGHLSFQVVIDDYEVGFSTRPLQKPNMKATVRSSRLLTDQC